MADPLVDSSIIIDFLRGRAEARDYLDGLDQAGTLVTSIVVEAEVSSGAVDRKDLQGIEKLFRRFQVIAIHESDGPASLAWLRQFRLSHGVGWHDCLIAAACLRMGLEVATHNTRHFEVIEGLGVIRPY